MGSPYWEAASTSETLKCRVLRASRIPLSLFTCRSIVFAETLLPEILVPLVCPPF
jgi:hypothetical protein